MLKTLQSFHLIRLVYSLRLRFFAYLCLELVSLNEPAVFCLSDAAFSLEYDSFLAFSA